MASNMAPPITVKVTPPGEALAVGPRGPLARLGGSILGLFAYLGGLALLAVGATRTLVRRPAGAPALAPAVIGQVTWMLAAGLPLVGLLHVGLGSFLAMQAFYGATFVVAAGPVVAVGLCRNVAPLMSGMTLAGILACRLTWDLGRRPLPELDDDPRWVPDRAVQLGRETDPRTPPHPARLVAVRVLAAALAGPILALWGTVAGTLIGWLIAREMLSLPTPIFFAKALEMLWVRDIFGLVAKGSSFATAAALLSCYEGLRARTPDDPRALPASAARAASLSALAILVLNMSWYVFMYIAGPPFGPTVLAPPS